MEIPVLSCLAMASEGSTWAEVVIASAGREACPRLGDVYSGSVVASGRAPSFAANHSDSDTSLLAAGDPPEPLARTRSTGTKGGEAL